MAAKKGFTVLEVVVASSVLVVALVGVMSGAFAVLRTSKNSDLTLQAANLASERLAYFRSCPNPYIAVGGTYYPAPENPRTHRDYNSIDWWQGFHNVWNDRPVLLVREWLYGTTEPTARSVLNNANPTNALARKFAQTNAGAPAADLPINAIPPMPKSIPGTGTQTATVAGVYPDWFNNTAGARLVEPRPIFVNSPPGGEPAAPQVAFIPAPMANERFRGLTGLTDGSEGAGELPRTIKFVREVWVQTNSPLGQPFGNVAGGFVADRNYPEPPLATYGAGGAGAPGLASLRREVNGAAGDGTMVMDVPLWVVTVTVRVFAREPSVLVIQNTAGLRQSQTGSGRRRGLGYDPTKPLATLTGYFGLRRNF